MNATSACHSWWAIIHLTVLKDILNIWNLLSNNGHWQSWMDYCSQLWQAEMAFIHFLFKLKRENVGPRHCLTKCALGNKLLNQTYWSWYHLSQEELLLHWYQLLHPQNAGSMPFRFFYGPPCICVETKERKKNCNCTSLCISFWDVLALIVCCIRNIALG